MYLMLDVGNSRTKAALYSKGEIAILDALTPDHLSALPLKGVYVACVGSDERINQLQTVLKLKHLPWVRLQSEETAFGVKNAYATPARLGVDRWLALLGADSQFKNTDLMIADIGTALTIDWLNHSQQHQGGWIIPGLRLQQEAVINNTAKVLSLPDDDIALTLGTNTQSCVKNGALAAICGAIRAGWQLQPVKLLVLTGGDAQKIAQYLPDVPLQHDPLLIFRGIARYLPA